MKSLKNVLTTNSFCYDKAENSFNFAHWRCIIFVVIFSGRDVEPNNEYTVIVIW